MIVAVPALLLALPKREFNRVAIFTRQTAQVCTLAVVCPALCSEVGFTGKDFDPSLLSLVVATPTAFSINAAYQRRERALQGLADMTALAQAAPNPGMAGLREAVEGDEQRLAQLEELFHWIDGDGDGKLRLDELEAAAQALGGSQADTAGRLLDRIREQAAAAPLGVDLATFVNLMTAKAVSDYTAPERELLPAFEALDVDGDGTISQDELLTTIENFCSSLPETEGCELEQRSLALRRAFDAFANEEQLLDYERFVEMVAGRAEQDECELPDDSYSSIFGP